MLDHITYTAFLQPHRRSNLLTRPRLNRLLSQLLQSRLTLIIAPAGYGKTSLLIDFAQQSGLPICWYTIDQSDFELIRFLENLVSALAYRNPGFGGMALPFIQDVFLPEVGMDRVVTVLVNEIFEKIKHPCYLFLDDFHLVGENKEIRDFLNRLIQRMGENCHLILSSRKPPLLTHLDAMFAHSQAGFLGMEELAFQPVEIQQLALQNYSVILSLEEAQQIAQETDGWITGFILSSGFPANKGWERRSSSKSSNSRLYPYLTKHILDPLPLEQRKFLLRTSVFINFDSGLCETVLGRTVYPEKMDWDDLVDSVVQNNLFVLTFQQDGENFRYTHFFRDFLRFRLEVELPGEKAVLLHRLAEVNMERGRYEEAYQDLTQLGDDQAIMRLVEKAGPHLLLEGQHHILISWIDRISASILESSPHLLSLKGAAKILGEEGEQALPLLNRAESSFRSSTDRLGLAQALVRRCMAYQFMGNHQAALSDAEEALVIMGDFPSDQFSRAEALGIKGIALYDLGKSDAALKDLSLAEDIFRSLRDEGRLASILLDIGMVYRGRGEIQASEDMYHQAMTYLQGAKDKTRLANVYNNLGRFLLQQGNYSEAASKLNQAMEIARQIGYSQMEAFVLFSFGELFAELDAFEASRQMYALSRQIARQLKHLHLIFSIDLAESDLARRMKSPTRAMHLLHNAEQYVSGSISTQDMSSYQFVFGVLALAEGRYDAALESLDRALISFQMAKRKIDVSRTLFYQAVTYFRLNLLGRSLELLEQALLEFDPEVGSRPLVVAGWEAMDFLVYAQTSQSVERPVSLLLDQIREFRHALPINRRMVRVRARALPTLEPQIQIWGFGEPEVKMRSRTIKMSDWQSPQQVEMLIYLILQPDGATRTMLEDDFWPDQVKTNIRFKNAIYRLKRILGKDMIHFDGKRYVFDRNLDYECDLEEFSSRCALAETNDSEASRFEDYQRVAELYHRGAFFQAPAGTWVNEVRENFQQKFLKAAYYLAHTHFELQEYSTALDYCSRILKEDECQEEAHQLAMLSYAGLGKRTEIEKQYRWCFKAFDAHWQIKPSEPTRLLYERLIR